MGGGASTLTLPTLSGKKLTFTPVSYKTHQPKHRKPFYCFLDIEIRDKTFGDSVKKEQGRGGARRARVVVKLHGDRAPKTCENFRGLCTGTPPLPHFPAPRRAVKQ